MKDMKAMNTVDVIRLLGPQWIAEVRKPSHHGKVQSLPDGLLGRGSRDSRSDQDNGRGTPFDWYRLRSNLQYSRQTVHQDLRILYEECGVRAIRTRCFVELKQ
ncbi:hypothetical protein T265_05357 [Opisthorchis viverrini]|uniref:Uncharacterized protein n=1 Tax=Opisthorchis viverrini TaxID=6198 RepID=A0A074ZP96_OPIVI|nr:hypothetical protein T265_05357 [Opisthorchis viverrini]KER27637.1 hypothetical protein T265_05357 [Opisthorchis viverrini]